MSEKGDKTLGVSHEVIDLTSDAEDDQIVDEAETGLAATQRLALQLATTTKRK